MRNRKNKSSPKVDKIKKGKIEELTPPEDHDMLKKSIEKLQHLNENLNRDSVSNAVFTLFYISVIRGRSSHTCPVRR